MKRRLKAAVAVVTTAIVLGFGGVGWYAFYPPPIQQLALAQDLVDATSAEGRQILRRAAVKTDYEQLSPEFVTQSRRGFCGVATSVAVINAALHPEPRVTQKTLFTPAAAAVRGELAVSLGGMTLDQLAGILRTHGLEVRVTHAAESDLASFRDAARATLGEPRVFLVVNYDRKMLGQSGPGHISPLGAYDSGNDRVLVLDVAGYKYPYTWVPVAKLWSAMNTTDSASGKTRGYLLVAARAGAHLSQ